MTSKLDKTGQDSRSKALLHSIQMSQAKHHVRKFYREKIPGLCAVMKKTNPTDAPLPRHCSTLKLYPLTNQDPQLAEQCICVSAVRLVALSARQAGRIMSGEPPGLYGSRSTFHDFLASPEDRYLIKTSLGSLKKTCMFRE